MPSFLQTRSVLSFLFFLLLSKFASTFSSSSSSHVVREFYSHFNDLIDTRLLPTFDKPTSVSTFEGKDGDTDGQWPIPIVHSRDLKRAGRDRILDSQSSCCLVYLDDDEREVQVMERLWQTMENAIAAPFVGKKDEETLSPTNASSSDKSDNSGRNNADLLVHSLMHQELTRKDSTKNTSGYDYINYPPFDASQKELLIHLVEADGAKSVGEAFQLVATIGKQVVAASAFDCDAQSTKTVTSSTIIDKENDSDSLKKTVVMLDRMLLDSNQCYSGSFQRLARYKESSAESIRPHCDWSFATMVPVSSTTGLEIYNGNVWIRPEDIAKAHYQQQRRREGQQIKKTSGKEVGCDDSSLPKFWNARYIVVIPGKWLEIMTLGKTPATIHRVEGSPTARLSAPLFLRPQPQVSEAADKLVLDDCTDILACQRILSEFLCRGTSFAA